MQDIDDDTIYMMYIYPWYSPIYIYTNVPAGGTMWFDSFRPNCVKTSIRVTGCFCRQESETPYGLASSRASKTCQCGLRGSHHEQQYVFMVHALPPSLPSLVPP